ncbi:MAG: hypothetical protein M1823_000353 [Watsoniomyces obsoletus]|nr:MAG: hypothetical protein M1823_000353 [Watsoniomyces obsoletus]
MARSPSSTSSWRPEASAMNPPPPPPRRTSRRLLHAPTRRTVVSPSESAAAGSPHPDANGSVSAAPAHAPTTITTTSRHSSPSSTSELLHPGLLIEETHPTEHLVQPDRAHWLCPVDGCAHQVTDWTLISGQFRMKEHLARHAKKMPPPGTESTSKTTQQTRTQRNGVQIGGVGGGLITGGVRGEQLEYGDADRGGGGARSDDEGGDKEEVQWDFAWNDDKDFEDDSDEDEMDLD